MFYIPESSVAALGATLEAREPQALFDSHISLTDFNARFDVSKDGRFLILVQPEQSNDPLTVIVN